MELNLKMTVMKYFGVVATATALTIAGCGTSGDERPTAKVTGKVTVNGTPVTSGELVFSPTGGTNSKNPGQAGRGPVKSDGTYEVSTYGNGDGAVVGKHRVSYFPQPADTGPHGEATSSQPAQNLVPAKETVEVAKGANSIDIELVPAPAKQL
jgi:hypothetical protein